ncbi:MAG: hypothetical protein II822_09920 [Prevotella sp.]|nr:hypothetical protein [Prevotella sp.]
MGVEVHERYINPYTLFEQAEIARFTPEERREYQESIKDYWDYYSTMKTAEDKGHAAGLEEGRAAGLEEGRAAGLEEGIERVARAMKASGVSVAEIIKFTGLTEEQVAQL